MEFPAKEIDLNGKTALVTGGGRGIGKAIAAALVRAGMRVHICGRNKPNLDATVEELGDAVTHSVCDLAVAAAPEAMFAEAREQFDTLFLLVNNAAVGVYAEIADIEVKDWDQMMAVNVRGAMLCAQEAYRWMQGSGGGRIVNISSVVGHKGYVNQAGYAASKHALMGLTKVMAREGQEDNIRSAAICPGGVATEMVRQARPDLDPAGLIQPADVARAVLYLAREPESCCTDFLYLRRSGSTPFA